MFYYVECCGLKSDKLSSLYLTNDYHKLCAFLRDLSSPQRVIITIV